MANKLLTYDEMRFSMKQIIQRECARCGITEDDFYRGLGDAWNAAIARDEAEESEKA